MQFDLYRTSEGNLLVDCQTDMMHAYNTRVAIPLLPFDPDLPRMERLNPVFDIFGEDRTLMTEFMAAIPMRQLQGPVGSLARHEYKIKAALDMLISGY